jgi:formate dehydrogenase major subunit
MTASLRGRPMRSGFADRAAGFLRDWSVPRQLRGAPEKTKAAESAASRTLRPRLETADKVGTSICPYCAVGCAQLVYAKDGRPIAVEGDPRSPVNQGTLCPKGSATFGLMVSPQRLDRCLHRAPGAREWREVGLDWAMERIAQLAKRTRDETFTTSLPDGTRVNQTLGIASMGGATLDNEENYLIKKLFSGGLGMVFVENQARVCHNNSVPGLGATYGRGASTMPQWDLANSDAVLVMGSNMAENHPISFRFVMQAKLRGATVMHVDPRFTRTSALADIHAPIRAGTDIAFLGGIIRHLLENDLWFRDYALPYTNLSTIVGPDYKGPEELGGYFSGWDEAGRRYAVESWQYDGVVVPSSLAEGYVEIEGFAEATKRLHDGPTPKDPTLTHPRCVYQILKRHYARYTPEMVQRVTGCPQELFLKVADALARASGRERTAAICYAVGWNHHTKGAQIIRAAGILQALLGNTGRPGGGILALRGHTSIQGSTDIATLYDLLPGYMPQPHAFRPHATLEEYLGAETNPTGWWHNFPKYYISLMRAWYGAAATPANGWGHDLMARVTGDHSQLPLTVAMERGVIRGLFVMGQNPVVGGSNSKLVQRGLARLEWMVVRDVAETDTATFWRNGHLVRDGEMSPEDIGTEVFLMPASLSGEKAGTFTNIHRLVQWHDKVVDAPGDSRSELWFTYHLGRRLKAMYATSARPEEAAIQALAWDYPVDDAGEPDAEAVLREINGYTVADGKPVAGFQDLKDDGSTACGCWIYSGVFPEPGRNRSRARVPDGAEGPGTHLGWGFAWPDNRRTLNNRASADPAGAPWSERKRLAWWDEAAGEWRSHDRVDFPTDKRPDFEPDWDAKPAGMDAIRGDQPYIMIPDGVAGLFVPSGLKDGPLPEHYEPTETPVPNALHPGVEGNPAAKRWAYDANPLAAPGDPRWPHALTTFRLTEHHSGGTPTRIVPSTAELQPEGFVEIPTELARSLGIGSTDWVVLSTPRGEIETRALVTDRLRPFALDAGRVVHQIGLPWHYGWSGIATGDIANVLTAVVGDPNTGMHENKALVCALRPGRLARALQEIT